MREGTFFDKSKSSFEQVLLFVNLFCASVMSYKQLRFQGQLNEQTLSNKTITDWLSYCHEVCLETVSKKGQN